MFDDIWENLKMMGLGGALSGFLMHIFDWLFKNNFFTKFIGRKFGSIWNGKSNQISQSDVQNHDIFKMIERWERSTVPSLIFSTPYRTIIFRRYLQMYLKSNKTKIQSFVEKRDFEKMETAEFWSTVINMMNETIADYESTMSDVGMPDIIIEKMKIHNNDLIDISFHVVTKISKSEFYNSESNLLKMNAILDILSLLIQLTIFNSKFVCYSIKDELKGNSVRHNGIEYVET